MPPHRLVGRAAAVERSAGRSEHLTLHVPETLWLGCGGASPPAPLPPGEGPPEGRRRRSGSCLALQRFTPACVALAGRHLRGLVLPAPEGPEGSGSLHQVKAPWLRRCAPAGRAKALTWLRSWLSAPIVGGIDCVGVAIKGQIDGVGVGAGTVSPRQLDGSGSAPMDLAPSHPDHSLFASPLLIFER